jgi:hypothetical protein
MHIAFQGLWTPTIPGLGHDLDQRRAGAWDPQQEAQAEEWDIVSVDSGTVLDGYVPTSAYTGW